MFKLKDRYKLDLKRPENIKLFNRTKKLIDKIKNGKVYRILKLLK